MSADLLIKHIGIRQLNALKVHWFTGNTVKEKHGSNMANYSNKQSARTVNLLAAQVADMSLRPTYSAPPVFSCIVTDYDVNDGKRVSPVPATNSNKVPEVSH